jgi:hypothetical protein
MDEIEFEISGIDDLLKQPLAKAVEPKPKKKKPEDGDKPIIPL